MILNLTIVNNLTQTEQELWVIWPMALRSAPFVAPFYAPCQFSDVTLILVFMNIVAPFHAPCHFSDVTLILAFMNALNLQRFFLQEMIVRPGHLGKGIGRCAYV